MTPGCHNKGLQSSLIKLMACLVVQGIISQDIILVFREQTPVMHWRIKHNSSHGDWSNITKYWRIVTGIINLDKVHQAVIMPKEFIRTQYEIGNNLFNIYAPSLWHHCYLYSLYRCTVTVIMMTFLYARDSSEGNYNVMSWMNRPGDC